MIRSVPGSLCQYLDFIPPPDCFRFIKANLRYPALNLLAGYPMNKPWAIILGLCGFLAGAATDRFVLPHTSVDAVDRLAFPNRSVDTITLLRTAGFSEREIRAYCMRETSAFIEKQTRTTWSTPPATPPRR